MSSPRTVRLLVVMDPFDSIDPRKDSTAATMLEAQRREWSVQYGIRELERDAWLSVSATLSDALERRLGSRRR